MFGYCGGKYVKSLNKLMKQTHNYNVDANMLINAYGGLTTKGKGSPQVLAYTSPFGTVKFIYNPMIEGEVYSNSCLFLNWDYVSMKYVVRLLAWLLAYFLFQHICLFIWH